MPVDSFSQETVVGRSFNDEQRAAVIEEMKLILAHPIFKNSNRCVALLHYVVECALSGGAHEIKERTLGIEVFGRNANYDVGTDPIVRRVAGDIRKRLAQYYQEQNGSHKVRIQMIRGSYLPEFEFAADDHARETIATARIEVQPEPLNLHEPVATEWTKASEAGSNVRRRVWMLRIGVAALVIAASLGVIRWRSTHSAMYRIWKPLLDSGNVITVCLPTHDADMMGSRTADSTAASTKAAVTSSWHDFTPGTLMFRDALDGNTITELLSNFKKQASVRPSSALKFRDFHQAPVVLIGGLNNPWVPILLSNLRYTLHYDPANTWIQDGKNPSSREWLLDNTRPTPNDYADYALITRVFDPEARQWIMALSGLTDLGTEAAAEFVTDPNYEKLIPASVNQQGNFQIVLKTSVIGGEPGPLQILAVQTW